MKNKLFKLLSYIEKHLYLLMISKQVWNTRNTNIKVSIIIVTHNALSYTASCVKSLSKTANIKYEVVVVDNNSDKKVKEVLGDFKKKKLIHTLFFSKKNLFFSGGNNKGLSLSSSNASHLLLLNSDTEVIDENWLNKLVAHAPKYGIISFGTTFLPIRPDGWCLLINKSLFKELGGLNEFYKMNGSITELTSNVLKKGYEVSTIINPDDEIKHYGGKSYSNKIKISHFPEISTVKAYSLFRGYLINVIKI